MGKSHVDHISALPSPIELKIAIEASLDAHSLGLCATSMSQASPQTNH